MCLIPAEASPYDCQTIHNQRKRANELKQIDSTPDYMISLTREVEPEALSARPTRY